MSNLAAVNLFTNLKELSDSGQTLKLAEPDNNTVANTPPTQIDNKNSIHNAEAHLRISRLQLDEYARQPVSNKQEFIYRSSLVNQISDVFDATEILIKQPNELNAQNYQVRANFAKYRISQDLIEPSAHIKSNALTAQNILSGLTDDKRIGNILGNWATKDFSIESITMENKTIEHKVEHRTEHTQSQEEPKPAKKGLLARMANSVKSFVQKFSKPQEITGEQTTQPEKPQIALLEKNEAIPQRVRNTINAYRQGNYERAFNMARGMGSNQILNSTKDEITAYARGIGKRQDWAYEFKDILEKGKQHDAKARIINTIKAFDNNDIAHAFKLSEKFPNQDEMEILKGDKKLREQFLKIVRLSHTSDATITSQAPREPMV